MADSRKDPKRTTTISVASVASSSSSSSVRSQQPEYNRSQTAPAGSAGGGSSRGFRETLSELGRAARETPIVRTKQYYFGVHKESKEQRRE